MKIAFLIASCDKYSDLWAPYLNLLGQNWPDCPYNIYLGTDSHAIPPCKLPVTVIHSGAQISWSRQVSCYLKMLPEEIVLFTLEDFYLRKRVDTVMIQRTVDWFNAHPEATSLRLNPLPPPDMPVQATSWLGEYSANIKYRISTQAALWRKTELLQLLRDDQSPWQLEQNKQSASKLHRYFGAYSSILPYRGMLTHHVVEKGEWLPHEVWWLRRAGLLPQKLTREIMPLSRYAVYLSRVLGSRIKNWLTIRS